MKTRQEKIEDIRQACIKANPSILDLEFGCKVKIDGGFVRDIWDVSRENDDDCDEITGVLTAADNIGMAMFSTVNDIKIIGRPIRLADVLYMLNHKEIYDTSISQSGYFEQWRRLPGKKWNLDSDDRYNWNLLDDNLEHQSDDTVSFIHQLIENK